MRAAASGCCAEPTDHRSAGTAITDGTQVTVTVVQCSQQRHRQRCHQHNRPAKSHVHVRIADAEEPQSDRHGASEEQASAPSIRQNRQHYFLPLPPPCLGRKRPCRPARAAFSGQASRYPPSRQIGELGTSEAGSCTRFPCAFPQPGTCAGRPVFRKMRFPDPQRLFAGSDKREPGQHNNVIKEDRNHCNRQDHLIDLFHIEFDQDPEQLARRRGYRSAGNETVRGHS